MEYNFGINENLQYDMYRWVMPAPLAELVVSGAWKCDLRFMSSHTRCRAGYLVETIPSRADSDAFYKLRSTPLCNFVAPRRRKRASTDAANCVSAISTNPNNAMKTHYTAQHIINFIKYCKNFRNIEGAKETMGDAIEFAFPDFVDELMCDMVARDFRIPSRFTHCRALVKPDAASVLETRDQNSSMVHLRVSRGLNPDCSPQGLEAVVCKEFVLCGKDTRTAKSNKLPLSTLAHRFASLIDRSMAIVHLIFLVAGPTEHGMRLYCHQTKYVLGDLGHDIHCGDAIDMVTPYLKGPSDDNLEKVKGTFLFPLAMKIPGPSHILDAVLYLALTRLLKGELIIFEFLFWNDSSFSFAYMF